MLLSSGEALTGLAAERPQGSVSDYYRFFHSKVRRSPGWRWKDPSLGNDPSRTRIILVKDPSLHNPSRTWIYLSFQERRSPGWWWKDPSLGDDPSRTRICFYPQKKALTGLAAERPQGSVLDYYRFFHFKVRRSPGWRWKDPSLGNDPSRTRIILVFRRGA